jgi:hypothetical protein
LALPLRHFLYLDDAMVGGFLGQLTGGRVDEEGHRLSATRGKHSGAEASLGMPGARLAGRLGGDSADIEESSYTVHQTPEARFALLYDILQEAQAIQALDAFDDEIWDQIRKGEMLEVETTVSVSAISRLTTLVGSIGPLMEAMETFGEPVDNETTEAIRGIEMLGSVFGTRVPAIARAAGAPKFKFIATLESGKIQVGLDELDGEATLLAKVQRKLRPGEKFTALDVIPGLSALPKSERRKLGRDLKNSPEFPDVAVSAPAAVVTPVAVYR